MGAKGVKSLIANGSDNNSIGELRFPAQYRHTSKIGLMISSVPITRAAQILDERKKERISVHSTFI